MDGKKIFWIIAVLVALAGVAAAVAYFVSRYITPDDFCDCDDYFDCDECDDCIDDSSSPAEPAPEA